MSIVEVVLGSLDEYPLLLTVEESAAVLRIGRSLAYELARLVRIVGRSRRPAGAASRRAHAGAALGAGRADLDRPRRAPRRSGRS